MGALAIVGLVLLGLWTLALLVLAIVYRRTMAFNYPPKITRWRAEAMPDALDEIYASVGGPLERLGFGAVGGLTVDNGAGIVHTLVLERDDGTLALLEHVVIGERGKSAWGIITFTPACNAITTWCEPVWFLPLLVPKAVGLRARLPVDDPKRAVKFHRRLCDELLSTSGPEKPDDPLEHFETYTLAAMGANRGWAWSESGGRIRMTVLGALAYAAVVLPPLFFVGRARARAAMRASIEAESGSLAEVRAEFEAARARHAASAAARA